MAAARRRFSLVSVPSLQRMGRVPAVKQRRIFSGNQYRCHFCLAIGGSEVFEDSDFAAVFPHDLHSNGTRSGAV
jgi:hypothetical protein